MIAPATDVTRASSIRYEAKANIATMKALMATAPDTPAARETLARMFAETQAMASDYKLLTWRHSEVGTEYAYDPASYSEVKVQTPYGPTVTRSWVPAAVDQKDYRAAFSSYLAHKGDVWAMGPTDRKTLSEGVDSSGGFAVSRDFQERVLRKLAASVAVYANATKMPTNRDVLTYPRVSYGTDDLYTSPVRLSWAGELPPLSTTVQATDPTLGQINIPVNTALATTIVTNDLMEDGGAEDLMTRLFGEAFSMGEAGAYMTGDGAAKPVGILTQVDAGDGPASVASGTSAAITTSSDAHSGLRLMNLWKALPSQYRGMANWIANSATLEAMENLVDAQKRPLLRELQGAGIGTGSMIKSRPVLADEFVPDIAASAFPIVFGDLSGYIIAERVGLVVRVLSEPYADKNLSVVLARRRVGGYLAEAYRVKVLKCA